MAESIRYHDRWRSRLHVGGLRRLLDGILSAPRAVLFGSLLVTAMAAWLATGVDFRTSRSEMAPEGDPEQERMDHLVAELGGTTLLIACVETDDGRLPDPVKLRSYTDALAAEVERLPAVQRVFHRAPVEWFLERALYLAEADQLEGILEAADGSAGTLTGLTDLDGLEGLNRAIAGSLAGARQGSAAPSDDAPQRIELLLQMIDAERRLLQDPVAFIAELDGMPPLQLLAGDHPALAADGYLQTRDGSKNFLMISPSFREDRLPVLRDFIGAVRAKGEEVSRDHPGFRIALTGRPAMTVEEMETVRRDTGFTAMVAIVGVTLLTVFVFRWRSHAVLVLGALLMGITWAFGAVRLELGYLNMITSSFISTLIGVGVAYGIHPVSQYELEGAHTDDTRAAVRTAFRRTSAAVTVSAVTTSVAFFSILLMRFPGFAELGLVAGVGVLLCLLAAIVTLPALLMLYGHRRGRRDRRPREGRDAAVVDRMWVDVGSSVVIRFPRTVTIVAILVTLWLGWHARGIGFNTNLLDLLPDNSEALDYQRRIVEESDLSPIFAMVLVDDVEQLRAIRDRAASEPSILRVDSVLRFLPRDVGRAREVARILERSLKGIEGPAAPLPIDPVSLEASLWELEEQLANAGEDAFGAGLGDLAGPLEEARATAEAAAEAAADPDTDRIAAWNEAQGRLAAFVGELIVELRRAAQAPPPTLQNLPLAIRERFVTDSGRLLAVLQPAESVFEDDPRAVYVEAVQRVSPEATGFPIVFHHVAEQITGGFYRSVAVGASLVLLLLLIDYRNLRDAALAMLPLIVGVLWMLGLMGLLGLDFNFANLVAVPLIIGVGIDNGVHVVHRLRFEGDAGMAAVLRHAGRAIVIAGLTTMIGFGSLGLASHRGLASLGLVLLVGVGSCLVSATIVLPNLLLALGWVKR